MSNINVVHGYPQQAWRKLPYQLAYDVHREFIGTRQCSRMRPEIIHGQLQDPLHLLELKRAPPEFGSRQWSFIAVTQQMPIIRAAGRRCAQQIFRQNHSRARSWTEAAMTAFPNAIETIAGSNHPCIRGRPLEVFAEIFKYRGRFWRKRSKIVDGLIHASRQASGSDVVSQDPAIDHLGKKCRLRNQFSHQMGDILLPLRSKSFLIARTSTESNDHDFPFGGRSRPTRQRTGPQ